MSMKAKTIVWGIIALVGLGAIGIERAQAAENVTLSVKSIKDMNLRIYGFLETDYITDTTAGFTEETDSNLVPTRVTSGGGANNFLGQHHRTELSIRNSRLGFDLTLPKTESGLASEAVFELDFLGNNAPNTAPGSAPGSQSERDFFNNAAVRVRHAYMNLTYDQWNAKVGQYWSLLGWQPYYFPGENAVLATPGMLYRRFAQARVTHTYGMQQMKDWTIESAADVAKPAEMNSGNPEMHAGLRLASTKYKGASTSGAGTSMVGLSAAVSGALIPTETNGIGNPMGQALAFDVLVPIIPSKDGSDRSNNLIWVGELVSGNGIGGLEVAGLTSGVSGITSATPNAGTAIDSGIAGVNANGNAELIQYRIWRNHLQYTLPGGKYAASVGYSQIEGRNLDRFSYTIAKANAISPKQQYGYLSLFYDPLNWLRFAGEVSQMRDTYNDPSNRFATNNRYQLTAFFVF